MSKAISFPHDRLFQKLMSDIRVAYDFFDFHLPDYIREKVDLSYLKLCPTNYISETLERRLCDVIYQTRIKGEEVSYVYLHVEHQRTVDPLMSFRVLEYKICIWNYHHAQTKSKDFPFILSMVLYQGKGLYTASLDFAHLMQGPKEWIERGWSTALLICPNQIEDEVLREQRLSGLMMNFMKHIDAQEILRKLKELIEHLCQFEFKKEMQCITRPLLEYLISRGKTEDKHRVVQTIKGTSKN